MKNKTLVEQFMLARAVGAPLVSITTPDQELTIRRLQNALTQDDPATPVIQWDCIRGWKSRNDAGTMAISDVLAENDVEPEVTRNPIRQMMLAEFLPEKSVLFILNAHHRTHQMERPDFWQAVWNLRDVYKANFRMVVILSPAITIPIDIASDVFSIDDPMPTEAELLEIVEEISSLTNYDYTKSNKIKSSKALIGLSPFAAEQAVALALRVDKIDVDEIYERKRELLNDIPGLSVYNGSEKFSTLGGCDEVKLMLTRILKGQDPPKVVVFIDEAEKMLAGATHAIGDNTGVSQAFMGSLLTFMEDNESDGTIFVGPTGTAKSALAKAMGNEAGIPTVYLDLGGMKNSLLGASEHRLNYALKVIKSLGEGNVFFIMTSNNIAQIPPEFKRRFSSGTYFFDIPTKQERGSIWPLYLKKYGIDKKQVADVNDDNWTGAEIRNCCRLAYRQKITLSEASSYIVPVAISGSQSIEALRRAAHKNFLSANYPGTYKYKHT